MPHGGYGKRRVAGRKTTTSTSHRSKLSGGVNKKPKAASLKNQIRSTERLLRKVSFFFEFYQVFNILFIIRYKKIYIFFFFLLIEIHNFRFILDIRTLNFCLIEDYLALSKFILVK